MAFSCGVSTVAEIKAAIDKLSPQERCELDALLHPHPDDEWDMQMKEDAQAGGKLYKMASESARNPEDLKDWPIK